MENNKKLTRASAGNRMVAGVCAGIADYFGWDPTLVRIGYILLRLGSHPIKNRLCISNNLHRFCRNHHIYHPMDRNAGKKTGRWI